jgi:hypothetical protein
MSEPCETGDEFVAFGPVYTGMREEPVETR